VTDFFAWLDAAGIAALVDIEPLHVAAYVEALGRDHGRGGSRLGKYQRSARRIMPHPNPPIGERQGIPTLQ
jgi:hypothetical protein